VRGRFVPAGAAIVSSGENHVPDNTALHQIGCQVSRLGMSCAEDERDIGLPGNNGIHVKVLSDALSFILSYEHAVSQVQVAT
jgi:hypothetical protein